MPSALTVIISGCHSGPNPSPGLGIATSLRAAFPDARLVGRDFSPSATGLHAAAFDEAWVCPPWDGADLDLQWLQLRERLEAAWMIPGLDLEVRWLAQHAHPRVLAPSQRALDAVSKPGIVAASSFPVHHPEWVALSALDRAVERFCRGNAWRVWVKGPAHEARTVTSWRELTFAASELRETWGGDGLFVQGNALGDEVSIAFAAYHGELLDAVFLEKQLTTSEGKVWGGNISSVPDHLLRPLRAALLELQWTGGGELEFIRDPAGKFWIFDWNPRFPAWVNGATLAGHNLPAALIARATGLAARSGITAGTGFVRTVIEVPQRLTLAPSAVARPLAPSAGKHPSGMPQLRRRLTQDAVPRQPSPGTPLPAELQHDLLDAVQILTATPCRVLLQRTANHRFGLASSLMRRHPRIQLAYSIKTNPSRGLLRLAKEAGLLAEAISVAELDWAIECGWRTDEIIYNGPVPLRRDPDRGPLLAAFADDAQMFEAYLDAGVAGTIGVRLCPPLETSRFGVCLSDPEAFAKLVPILGEAPIDARLGVSFHLASSVVGMARWERAASSVIDFASGLQRLSGRTFDEVDLGGGWAAEEFEHALEPVLERLMAEADRQLSAHPRFLLEPGKGLAEPAQALLTRVVHVRCGPDGRRAAVLDAGVADVPQIGSFPHRFALVRGDVTLLRAGTDELPGPTCMESDQVAAGVSLPQDLRVGDVIAICDAGGYDASMAYALGRGGAP